MDPAPQVTVDDYLALEAASDTKHEFVNGIILAMAGASVEHNLICANLIGTLQSRLQGRSCLVLTSDQRVHVEATGLYGYPNLTIVCERPRIREHPRPPTLLNPTVVIEVLSESTEAWDRGAKAAHYRSLPSLKEFVLVSQPERRVEHFRRLDAGQWLLTEVVGEGSIALPALGCEVSLAEIYANLDLVAKADIVDD